MQHGAAHRLDAHVFCRLPRRPSSYYVEYNLYDTPWASKFYSTVLLAWVILGSLPSLTWDIDHVFNRMCTVILAGTFSITEHFLDLIKVIFSSSQGRSAHLHTISVISCLDPAQFQWDRFVQICFLLAPPSFWSHNDTKVPKPLKLSLILSNLQSTWTKRATFLWQKFIV